MPDNFRVLRIVDGDRYEVNDKGGVWEPGQLKRSGPLGYVRLKIMGWTWGPGYRQLLEVAGKRHAPIAFAFFIKCLEVGANQSADKRWLIQGIPGPARNSGNSGKIAEQLGWLPSQVEKAIEVLTHPRVKWLEWVTLNDPLPGIPGIPGKPGIPPTEQNRTETPTESLRNDARDGSSGTAVRFRLDAETCAAAARSAGQVAEKLKLDRPLKDRDADFLMGVCLLAQGTLPESWLHNAVEATIAKNPWKTMGYFRRVLQETAKEHKHDLEQLLKEIPNP